jgi:diguanylate cyclase (GGDEF)-like protein
LSGTGFAFYLTIPYNFNMTSKSKSPEGHFQMLFQYAPISLWEEDFSQIKSQFDRLRAQGVQALDMYLEEHPDEIEACMARIKIRNVNLQTLEMYAAASQDELLANLSVVFRDGMRAHFRDELLALWQGALTWSGEGVNYRLSGEALDIRLHWRILPGSEQSWEQVLVTIENITARKEAERALSASEARLRSLFENAPISLWEEDYSALKAYLDELRTQGVTDLKGHLTEHPEAIEHSMGLIRVLNVNRKTLELFEAPDKATLLSSLDKVFRDEMQAHFTGELVDMWNGKTSYEREGINYSLSGEPLNVHLDWRLMPGHEQDFRWVLVAIQDITARKKAEDYLRYLGTHDVMTSLYNRGFFEDAMKKVGDAGIQPISIIIADLDRLKYVNDHFGHRAGDDLIRRTAEVLKASFVETDVIARIGGDEFAVLLPGSDAEAADEALERIQTMVGLNNKYYQGPELSISAGAATQQEGQSLEKVLNRADDNMYATKSMHRHSRATDK